MRLCEQEPCGSWANCAARIHMLAMRDVMRSSIACHFAMHIIIAIYACLQVHHCAMYISARLARRIVQHVQPRCIIIARFTYQNAWQCAHCGARSYGTSSLRDVHISACIADIASGHAPHTHHNQRPIHTPARTCRWRDSARVRPHIRRGLGICPRSAARRIQCRRRAWGCCFPRKGG